MAIINGTSLANVLNGTAVDDQINGLAGNDTLNGLGGNDTLDGGTGNDTMAGGIGNDTYIVDSVSDVVTEAASAGTDTVRSSVTWTLGVNLENLVLTGTAAINGTGNTLNNVITGNSAANILNGGLGNDTMIGGLGNDTYVVNVATDIVTEAASAGTDTVQSAVTLATLALNVENLTLTGTAAINGTGNTLANVLTGNTANNILNGGSGNDTLNGGLGNDTMIGGLGDDTYVVNVATDIVTEAASQGIDTVQSAVTYTLGTNVENLLLTGTAAINGTGNTLANVITGNTGNNVLSGLGGNDTMVGGLGNDTYVVDATGDVVTEAASAGTDLVQSSATFTLGLNVENLTLTGGSSINGTGNTLNNVITGNGGNNVLNGGAGNDTLIGGLGNDTYVVDTLGDIVTEAASAGIDTVQAGITYSIAALTNVENLTLTGTAAIDGTGNAGNNVISGNANENLLSGGAGLDLITGKEGDDVLVGGAGNDTLGGDQGNDNLLGGADNDILFGGADDDLLAGETGNDTLDGEAGADILLGQGGDDTLVWDAADAIINGGADFDTLQLNGALQTLDLVAVPNGKIQNIEAINITGTGNNTLNLNAADVVAISPTDTLRVNGNLGDAVTSGEFWQPGGTIDIDGTLYNVFTNGAATLHVHPDVEAGDLELTAMDDATSVLEAGAEGPGTPTATGNVLDNDVDENDPSVQLIAVNGDEGFMFGFPIATDFGTLVIEDNGSYSYNLDNGNAAVDALAEGQILTEVFSYTAITPDGAQSTAELTVTIAGANDAPVAMEDADSATEDGPVVSGSVATNDDDVDIGDDLTYSLDAPVAGLTLNPDGSYDFDPSGEAYQHIADSATQEVVASYTVTDEHGATASSTLTITVTGFNDPPVGVDDDNAGDAVTEAGVAAGDATAAGNVLDNDTDADDGHVLSVPNMVGSPDGDYGSVVINSDGSYTYTLDNGNAATNALAQGEEVTDTFGYIVSDGLETAQAELTITITGANDAPVAQMDDNNDDPVVEAGVLAGDSTATGDVLENDTDVDTGAVLTVASVFGGDVGESIEGTYGSVVINADGSYTYTLNDADPQTDALFGGQNTFEQFFYTMTDEHGATSESSLVINITGANDAPVALDDDNTTVLDPVVEAGNGEPGDATAVGNLLANDTDVDSFMSVSDVNGLSSNPVPGEFGSLVFSSDGSYTYTLNDANPLTDALAGSESVTEEFTYTVSDGAGGTDTATLTITISGTNDSPTIEAGVTGGFTEAMNAAAQTLEDDGNVTFDDVDNGALVDVDASYNIDIAWSGGDIDSGLADALVAGFELTTLTDETAPGGTNWNYSAAGLDLDFLDEGETINWSYTVAATDEHGATATDTLSFTITGTDDAAVITGDITGDVTEESDLVATGDLDVTDADSGEATFVAAGTTTTLGSYTVDVDGEWSYTLDNTNATVQALGAGDSTTDSFTVMTAGGDSQLVTITVNGTDDAAVITGDITGDVTEESDLVATGDLDVTDADSGEATFVAAGTTTTLGSYTVDVDGEWSYTLDNTNATVQALGAGDSTTDSFTVMTAGGDSQLVTITVNGTDDAAVITGDITGDVTEESDLVATGDLDVTDADSGEATFVAAGTTTTLGSYTVDVDGEWSYTLDNTNATVQALGAGDSTTDSFTVMTAGGDSQLVTITVNGTDDAAVITGDITGDVTEESDLVATGDLDVTDADSGEATFVAAGTTTTLGSYTVDVDGEWSYTLDNTNATVQALGAGDSTTDSFTVMTAGGDSQLVTITVNGTDDAAVITGDITGDVTEESDLVATGDLDVTDADSGEATFVAAGTTTTLGSYTVDVDGEWSYTLDNTNATVQALGAGDSTTDSFTVMTAGGDSQLVTITVNGTDDAAVITGDITGDVTEESDLVATGDLDVTDADSGEATFVAAGTTTTLGSYTVDVDGEWSYTLDNTNATVQALGAGDSTTDSFTVMTAGGDSQLVTITVNGTDDAAVITGDITGDVTEESDLVATGDLDVTDADSGEATFVAAGTTTTLGSYTVDVDGEWSYTLDNTNATVQALGAGDSTTDSFTVMTAGGDSQLVTITVNGTDDAAVITGDITGDVTEESDLVATGDLDVTDADSGEATFVAAGTTTTLGSYTVDVDGEWSYTLDNTNATVQALGAGDSTTDSFTVMTAGGDSQLVTITVNGTDDAAVITGDITGDVTEESDLVATGDLDVTDADSGEATFVAAGTTTTLGSYTVDVDGEWSYTLDNTNATVQALGAGDSTTDSFTVMTAGGDSQLVTITINGTNDAPAGTDNTVAVPVDDGIYTFTAADFGFDDPVDGTNDDFLAVRITTVPVSGGTLLLDGVAVNDTDVISVADITAGDLTFAQSAGTGGGTSTFTFQVQDNGGTANGGVDLDPSANTMTITRLAGDYVGTAGNDTFTGNAADAEVILGLSGDDNLSGGDGADQITGGLGADSINAGGADGDGDVVIYTATNEGAAAGANTGYDIIAGFVATTEDVIHLAGAADAAIDDAAVDGSLVFAADGDTEGDFVAGTGNEAWLLTNGFTGLVDADLVETDFVTLLAELNAVTFAAANGDDALIVVQGATDTGVYYYLENGSTAGDISAGELSLIAVIDNALLDASNFTTAGV